MKNYLIIGASHTSCIKSSVSDFAEYNIDFVHTKSDRFSTLTSERLSPDLVCLSIRGNFHNVLALFENPVPFTSRGMDLDEKDRVSIPSSLLKAAIQQKLKIVADETKAIHDLFPDASFSYICAPPPLASPKKAEMSPTFQDAVKYGHAPDPLRMLIYELQTDYYASLAKMNNAYFLEPPKDSLTEDGLLALEYSSSDPAHGNKKYGKLVLDQIVNWGENQK